MVKRQLPCRLDAEKSILGGILLTGGKAFAEVAGIVASDDFYHPVHHVIFAAMQSLDVASRPIDPITVAEQMRADGTIDKLRALGGQAYFGELASEVVTVENIGHYANLVRSKAERRKWIELASAVVAGGFSESDDDAFFEEAEARFMAMTSQLRAQGPQHVRKAIGELTTAIENRREAGSEVTGVPSGWWALDTWTAGFQPGDLVIVAARPSMGKSAFVSNVIVKAALEKNTPCLLFSLEMSTVSILERMVANHGTIQARNLRTGHLERGEWMRLTRSTSDFAVGPIWMDDSGSPTLLEIRSRARRWRLDPRAGGATEKAVGAIDYLQLIRSATKQKDSNREREISETSRGLKALARELRCPVIALSQLNRGLESRSDKRPMLSDLRESGAIEQDADLICFIYRDEVYDQASPDRGIAEIIIGKQRNGPTGTVKLRWTPDFSRFSEVQ